MTSAAPTPPLPAPFRVRADGWLLRPWNAADAPALVAMAADPLLRLWNPIERGEEGVEAWIAKRAVWDDHMSWAVVDAADVLVGSVSLWLFDWPNASASVGYWTAPAARGRGVATRATRAAASVGFERTGIERLTLFHAVENVGSCRVAERAGFAFEGSLRRSWRYHDGELHDEHLHALLRTDPGAMAAAGA